MLSRNQIHGSPWIKRNLKAGKSTSLVRAETTSQGRRVQARKRRESPPVKVDESSKKGERETTSKKEEREGGRERR